MQNLNILVVDDDNDMLNLFDHHLKNFFSNIYLFNCPLNALDHIKSKPTDLVISDIIMPKMNGIDLTREIKKFNSSIKIVISSEGGTTDSKDLVASILLNQALREGADLPLSKPFKKEQLLNVLETVLEASLKGH